jgi:dTDP-4-amino-4,6-dideoxygalactose transaminase
LCLYLEIDKKVVSTISGTAASHLSLILAGVGKGDEVICQNMTFSASAFPIVYQGGIPVFVDSELDTWNMCPDSLESAIKDRIKKNKKPKAIIVVHIYGMPANMSRITEVSQKYNIPIIEDAAEAIGSTYKGEKCGTLGDYGAFSFNGNKIITSSGGGVLICESFSDKERAIFLATQARDNTPYYEHSEIGYNYRMSNIIAAIGRAQLEALEVRIAERRKNNLFYQELFKNIEGCDVHVEPNESFFSNHWLSCVLIKPEISGFTNEDLRSKLFKEDIESRFLWKPMNMQRVFRESLYYGTSISENLFDTGLCLPSSSNLTNENRNRIKDVISRFLNK